ncbi:rho GTPase-activating protein 27-like isoform X3 [Spodoptera litura]|uniref:Rho GTPase-activating protein 27-like isoform X3 n=1 Tax=Spodoptera litura TaxID=69820 RepID=A0A9J7EP88_SPOLT|nr:rho GTPase-activating protein 27-like isoform X3 [Spodoptera litura]
MCELASWIPNAVAATLRSETAQPIIEWLTTIRLAIEEYDPLVTVIPPEPEPDTADNKFDEILSDLGKEIYKLDEYQRHLTPSEKEVSLSILNIFDECLEHMTEQKQTKTSESECESTLSDVSFVTSTPSSVKVNNNVNTIFDNGDGTPIPPRRARLKSICDNSISDMESNNQESDSSSDSESTCWSYKECSTDDNEVNPYAEVWAHSTGFHNSDEILRRVLSQHHATISRLSFDTASDFIPARYSVYALDEVGECKDRCVDSGSVAMTPDKPTDDGYEPVRDAITDENIYEEIEYGYSYTDEGCSCGGSVEVESCSISASSDGVGRDSPLYANLRDHDAYAIPPDVIYWKNLLLDPYFNDDEEDEWITPEECAVYSRDQRPPLVIPRITQYRNPRPRAQPFGQGYHEEDIPEQGSLRGKGYEALNNWSPTSERSRPDLDIMYNKSSSDSPPFVRINKRLGGSTENLLTNARRPSHLLLPASSSGDSLDVEIREREPHARNRKSRSMVAPKNRLQSPIPAPRHTLQQEVILEGPVKRTKFLEGTKKTKKNWIDCYMVLTPTALVFYKDQRTYYSSKVSRPPGTPPSPSTPQAELVLALLNAHATQCIQKHTKRYTRSILLIVGYDQYLIQDETEDGARKWFAHIRGVIFALYQCSLPGESPPPTFTHNNADADSLGRTPPTARHAIRNKHKAGGSSNEDSSDSTEVSIQKSQVRSKLRKFFAKRPPVDQLMRKGIYKDEPVFGRNLEEVCPATSPRVPEFVVACVKEIERPDNMCTDGLYRASGNLSQVQKIRLEVDQNKMSVIQNNTDIHVLTGSLKLFFRELKEPLIPCSMFDRVLAACSIKPKEARIKEFQEIVKALPPCNRDTLKFLLEHLIKVTEYKEQNRMHTANLAIVFGPTLLWAPPEQAHNIAVDCIQQNNVVDILLTDFKEIFVDNGSKGKKKA